MLRQLVASALLSSAFLGSIPLVPGLSACSATPAPPKSAKEYRQKAKRDYEEALDAYLSRDWETTRILMQDVRRKYGYSRYARLAELRIADAAYHQANYAEAIAGYKGFVHDYPNDREVPYARYKAVKAQFDSTSASVLLPPLEERDLVAVQDAYRAVESFLKDYPNYKSKLELEYMRDTMRGLLVRHELYVARYYLDSSEFDASIQRTRTALSEFKDSGLEAEALVLLGETYLKMKERGKARAAFRRVVTHYRDSPFVVPAQNFLTFMNENPASSP